MSQNVNIPSLIEQTQSLNNQARNAAQETLQQLQQRHYPNYLLELCRILQDSKVSSPVRQGAGLLLKNAITTTRGNLAQIRQRWSSNLDDLARGKIKEALLSTLTCPNEQARQTAVLVLSNLAAVETLQRWKDLIPTLLRIANSNPHAHCASLRCIGQIAETDTNFSDLQPSTPDILKCVASGMTKPAVQAESMKTLYSIVELIEPNMEQAQQQKVIMEMVCCGARQQSGTPMRITSFMTMGRIVGEYYSMMPKWMQQIFQISLQAIGSGVKQMEGALAQDRMGAVDDQLQEVTKQAIEVWSTTAEMEADILQEMKESPATCDRTNHGFVAKALEKLVPVYLEALKLQRDEFDEDEWTVRKAAACSLDLFAQVVGDHVLGHVLKFVEKNIGQSNWRSREAALCAFGTVMLGPSKEKLSGLVTQILPIVVKLMADNQDQVRLTAVWVLGRICDVIPESVDNSKAAMVLPPLVKALNSSAIMAEKACWCVASLAQSESLATNWMYSGQNGKQMIMELLQRVDKGDTSAGLVSAIHEALNQVITFAPSNDQSLVMLMAQQLFPKLVDQIKGAVQGMTKEDRGSEMLQCRLAGMFSTVAVLLFKVIDQAQVPVQKVLTQQLTDDLMQCCCKVLSVGGEQSLAYEDAFSLITCISRHIKGHFMKYLMVQSVQDLLCRAVQAGSSNEDICRVGVGCLGDVYSACMDDISSNPAPLQTYSDRVISELLKLLINTEIGLSLKQHIIGALADIMLAHGQRASRYSNDILSNCLQIGVLRPPPSADEDLWMDFNFIRVEICDVVRTCILELQNDPRTASQITSQINKFLDSVAADLPKASHDVLEKCISLLNDAVLLCKDSPHLKQQLKTQTTQRILERAGKQQDNEQLRALAMATFSQLE